MTASVMVPKAPALSACRAPLLEIDGDHWLGAGVAPTINVLVRGSDIYTPERLDGDH